MLGERSRRMRANSSSCPSVAASAMLAHFRLGPRAQPRDVAAVKPQDQRGDERQRGYEFAMTEHRRRDRRGERGGHASERGNPAKPEDPEPDDRVGQPDRPGERKTYARECRHALAATKAEPDRKTVADHGGERGPWRS